MKKDLIHKEFSTGEVIFNNDYSIQPGETELYYHQYTEDYDHCYIEAENIKESLDARKNGRSKIKTEVTDNKSEHKLSVKLSNIGINNIGNVGVLVFYLDSSGNLIDCREKQTGKIYTTGNTDILEFNYPLKEDGYIDSYASYEIFLYGAYEQEE